MIFKALEESDCACITELALRSKAHWGYDSTFMEACVTELTLRPDQLARGKGEACWEGTRPLGFYLLLPEQTTVSLELFYVDPNAMGRGLGRQLFERALLQAKTMNRETLRIVADPNAEGFYKTMGAITVGRVPSGSIADRFLPEMQLHLN